MKRLPPLLIVLATLGVSERVRAESPVFDTGIDAVVDSSLPEVLDDTRLLDADDSAVSDDADATDDAMDAADTAPDPADTADTTDTTDTAPPDDTFEAAVDSGSETRPPAIDSTAPAADTGQPSKPPVITENPSDPFSRDPDRDGCTCNAPKTASDAGAYAAIIALAAVMLRRKRR